MGASQSKRGEYKTQKTRKNPDQAHEETLQRSFLDLDPSLQKSEEREIVTASPLLCRLCVSEADSRSLEQGIYQVSEGLIEPKKLPNPVKESRHHQELHRELLFTHRRGTFPEHKPELQRVLEARRIRLLKQQEEMEKPLTDLEEELKKRQQKLDQYEQELVLTEEQDSRPEFILVKESLRKIKLSTETETRQT
ncbi:hypothetical protein lerEdw1_018744 [Lerista edwardsae]|nr:hypothetical protein lerEdw1_018744 [Lerista edwardsae]